MFLNMNINHLPLQLKLLLGLKGVVLCNNFFAFKEFLKMGATCHRVWNTPDHELENKQIRAVLILSAFFCFQSTVSRINAFFFPVCFATGSSGKGPRTKDQKKKSNKQRLRFRAQNQHSDHLASVRAAQ